MIYRIYCDNCTHEYEVRGLEYLDFCPVCEEEHIATFIYEEIECKGFEYEEWDEDD